MGKETDAHLSRRERQIMDIIYRAGQATAAAVMKEMPDPPSYSAVRAMLKVLAAKGHVRHWKEGRAYVYGPTVSKEKARAGALRRLVKTFFDGKADRAVAALIDDGATRLSDDEYEGLRRLIEKARKEGR